MEFKGIKGEWHVGQDSNVYDENGFDILEMSSPYRIKENWEDTGVSHWGERKGISYIDTTDEEVLANAHLIAAAPELLNALQDLVRFCEENEVGAELEYAKESINKALNR